MSKRIRRRKNKVSNFLSNNAQEMTEEEAKAYHKHKRRQIILDYATRQLQRTDIDKETDFEELIWFQEPWVETRMSGPPRSWERWDGMIEEWEPWNMFGEPVNRWRYYKKK